MTVRLLDDRVFGFRASARDPFFCPLATVGLALESASRRHFQLY